MPLSEGQIYFWRFKGEKAYRFGYATRVKGSLFRMGTYNGDCDGGTIVDEDDIEVKQG